MSTAQILDAVQLTIATVDYSESLMKIQAEIGTEVKDVTVFDGGGSKEVIGGLESGSLKLKFVQGFSSGEIDAVMWAAMKARQPVAFSFHPFTGATSTSNPKYSGYILVSKWTPINGSPGDDATVDVDWPTSGETIRSTT
jgi:hypothetical protein